MIIDRPFYYLFSGEITIDEEKYIDTFDRGIYYGIAALQASLLVIELRCRDLTFTDFFIVPLVAGGALKLSKYAFCKLTKYNALVEEAKLLKSQTWPIIFNASTLTAAVIVVILAFSTDSLRTKWHNWRHSYVIN